MEKVQAKYDPKRGTLQIRGGSVEIHQALGSRQHHLHVGDVPTFYYQTSLVVLTSLIRTFEIEFLDSVTEDLFKSATERVKRLGEIRSADDWGGPQNLRPYQRTGVAFLKTAERAILADDPGLGKTASALLAIVEGPTLVITRKYLKLHWMREIEAWRPDLKIYEHDAKLDRGEYDFRNAIVVMGYEEFVRSGLPTVWTKTDKTKGMDAHFGTLIVDEAQAIVYPKSQRSKTVRAAARHAKNVYLLTATPIRSTNANMWALLNALDPQVWTSYWRFVADYCEVVEGPFGKIVTQPDIRTLSGRQKIDALKQVLEFYLIKREVKKVMPDLPEKIRVDLPLSLSRDQMKLYEALETNLAIEVGDRLLETPGTLALLLRLRQICLDPILIGAAGESSRTDMVMEILREYVEHEKEQVVIFSFFAKYLELLRTKIPSKYEPILIEGSVPIEKRDHLVEDFTIGHARVLLGTVGAMGLGIDLSSASTCLFTDLPWTEEEVVQAESRLHRFGQSSDVHVIRLYAQDTVEEHVRRIVATKERADHDILDTAHVSRKSITKEILREIRKGVRRIS